MSAENRLERALAAPAAPAKDLAFTLAVMRQAEAVRYRADMRRRLLRGAGYAGLAVLALTPLASWAGAHIDAALELALAGGAALAGLSLARALRVSAPLRR